MDPTALYNSMQQQAGLLPAPQVIFPGQVSAAIAAQGGVGAFGTLFPTQTYQTAVGSPPIFQGPTGLMAPINPSAPYNPYAQSNPYAGMAAFSGFRGAPSPYAPYAPNPPPAYGGLQGQNSVPFAPAAPFSPFNTAYGSQLANDDASHVRSFAVRQAMQGVAARAGADFTMAATGAAIGARFGGATGAAIGGVAGFVGSELIGFGQDTQNMWGNNVANPRSATFGAGLGIERLSQSFVSSGPSMHLSGQGFSAHASQEAAQGISDLASSASFRRSTQNRFNQQDLFKITQGAAEAGLMGGVGSAEQMTSRVKDVAKSLSAFMELAKEPDVVRAIQTMGSLRSSGLNLRETMNAVSTGRAYARMAGTSFQGMAELGGSMGSQTFQSMGMTQGLGFQAGMAGYANAAASINRGTLSPQLAALAGGAQGLGGLNTMFSGSMLQLPMLTPGMMSAGGGIDSRSVQGLLSGRSDLFGMTARGSSVLGGMANQHGVGGLGMAIAMQPLLQDSVGRMVQSQGAFAGRHMEDRQILAMSRQRGMSGSTGYLTAGQALGLDRTQALARATELGSASYWSGQRDQLGVQQAELRANEDRRREADAPNMFGSMMRGTRLGAIADGASHLRHQMALDLRGGPADDYSGPSTEEGRRALHNVYRTKDYQAYTERQSARAASQRGRAPSDGLLDRLEHRYDLATFNGLRGGVAAGLSSVLGGLRDDTREDRAFQRREMETGGQFADDLLNSTTSQRRRAAGMQTELFGSSGGVTSVATGIGRIADARGGKTNRMLGSLMLGSSTAEGVSGIASLFGASVLKGAGAAGLGLGLGAGLALGTEGISGGNFSEIYRNSMRQQGMSEDRIRTNLRDHSQEIAASVGQTMEAYGMSPEQRAALERTSGYRRGGAPIDAGGQREVSTAYRNLGLNDEHSRSAFRSAMEQARGFGREGTAEYERSRRAIASAALISRANTNVSNQGRGYAAIDKLLEGLSPAQRSQAMERIGRLSGNLSSVEGAESAGQALSQGDASTLDKRTQDGDTAYRVNTAARRASQGWEALRSAGGVMGNALRGVNLNDPSAVQAALRGMNASDRAALREEGRGGSRYADMIERGDFAGANQAAGGLGERADRQRAQWDEKHSWTRTAAGIVGGMNPLALASGGLLGRGVSGAITGGINRLLDRARESEVGKSLSANSAAERDMLLQGRDSTAAQSEASGAGLGRAGDALLDAARELRQATENMNNYSTNAGLQGLTAQ